VPLSPASSSSPTSTPSNFSPHSGSSTSTTSTPAPKSPRGPVVSELPERDPIGADRRRSRRRSRLPADAACAFCGHSEPDALEVNHGLGRAASAEATVVLCRNHHAHQTGRQHDHDALPPLGRGGRSDSCLERIARALLSLAVFVHELAHALTDFAGQLFAF